MEKLYLRTNSFECFYLAQISQTEDGLRKEGEKAVESQKVHRCIDSVADHRPSAADQTLILEAQTPSTPSNFLECKWDRCLLHVHSLTNTFGTNSSFGSFAMSCNFKHVFIGQKREKCFLLRALLHAFLLLSHSWPHIFLFDFLPSLSRLSFSFISYPTLYTYIHVYVKVRHFILSNLTCTRF